MNRNDLNPELREGIALRSCIGLLETCSVARGIEVMAGQQSDLAARVADLRRRILQPSVFNRNLLG